MRTVTVMVPAREGYQGFYTPGRLWPNGKSVVEVADQPGDPEPFHTHRIGLTTLKQLEAESAFLAVIEGGALVAAEKHSEQDRIAQLESDNKNLGDQLADVRSMLARLLEQGQRAPEPPRPAPPAAVPPVQGSAPPAADKPPKPPKG